MDHVIKPFLVFILAITGLMAGAKGDEPPAERYKGLMKEFSQTARGLYEAKSDEERMAVAEKMVKLTPQFMELGEKTPEQAVAMDGLTGVVVQEIWMENNTLYPGKEKDNLEDRAISLLLERYIGSVKLGEVCTRVSYGFRKSCETLLRTALEKSPHREVQGMACLRLAQFLNNRMRRMDLLKDKPEMARRYQVLFGKDYLEGLDRMDRGVTTKEVEVIFERAAREFADVKLPYNGSVGATAKLELHEIRHLSVGKEAPEIEAADEDGKPFKLSGYRGRVVLLYFWSEY
ncbi:MAG TPA: hypothetical protein VG796_28585 [Verrucomicrobiales bacterium]|jgi:hypothetical protein|nr:hypothetical protein [Verrucomicrobiales bacterium]